MPPLGKLLSGYPNLLEFLASPVWDDGKPRKQGKLRLDVWEGRWNVCLTDVEMGEVAFVSGETPDDVLAAADDGLGAGTIEWRKDRYAKGVKRS